MTEVFPFDTEQKFPFDQSAIAFFADAIPHKIWVADRKGHFSYVNKQYIEYADLSIEELEIHGDRLIHPDDWVTSCMVWKHAMESGEAFQIIHRLRRKDGVYRWHLSKGMPCKDATGEIILWVGSGTDIDDQKRSEDALQESEAQFRTLAEALPQLVWVAMPNGDHIYFNQRWYDYTHMTLEEAHGDGWIRCLHPDDVQYTFDTWHASLRSGALYQVEHRVLNRATGEYRWFLTRGMPVRDSAANITRWFGTSTDIDEQKHTEDMLRQSQERVQKLMDANIIGIMVNDDRYILEANDALLEMLGYTRADMEARRMDWREMTPAEYTHLDQIALEELKLHGRCKPFEKEYIRKDGSRIPVLLGIVELQHDPMQYICFVLDITARKTLEQRKDDFIGMASHELKTPITTIKVQEQMLRRRFVKQGAQDMVDALLKMETQINRLIRLINDLLDVSKMQSGKIVYRQERFDADSFIREAIEMVQQTNPQYKIVLHGIAQQQLLGDRERLNQVLTNLLNNAIKYSPEASNVDVFVMESENTLTISVRDYGIGIPHEQLSKIFERFYRVQDAKHKGFPGLGMGLYISAEIVRHHGGCIAVESEEGQGTTFHVILPLHVTDIATQ